MSSFDNTLADSTTAKSFERQKSEPAEIAECAVAMSQIGTQSHAAPVSFTQSTFLDFPPRGFTLRWYDEFLQSNAWTSATLRSLAIALIVAVVAMPIGGAAAFVLAREQFRGKKLLMALVLSPLILPRMVIAVALF